MKFHLPSISLYTSACYALYNIMLSVKVRQALRTVLSDIGYKITAKLNLSCRNSLERERERVIYYLQVFEENGANCTFFEKVFIKTGPL